MHSASHFVTVSLALNVALIRDFSFSSDQVCIVSEAPSAVFANAISRKNIDEAALKRKGLQLGE